MLLKSFVWWCKMLKLRQYFIISILFLSFFIIGNFVTALSSDGTTSLLKSNISARGLTIRDSAHIYLLCLDNQCDSYGTDVSVLRYEQSSNAMARTDSLSGAGSLPMMRSVVTASNGKEFYKTRFDNLNMIDNGYYLYNNRSTLSFNVNFQLYKYDFGLAEWTLMDTFTQNYGAGVGSGGDESFPVKVFNAKSSSTFPNDTYLETYAVLSYVPYQITKDNTFVYDSNVHLNNYGMIIRDLNPTSAGINSYTFFSNLVAKMNTSINLLIANGSNFTTIGGTPVFGDIIEGVVDRTADYFYVTNGLNVYYGNVSTSINSNGTQNFPISLNNYANCSSYFGIMNVSAMMCINRNNCIFVGYRIANNNSMAIAFDGTKCISYQSQMSEEFNITQTKLYDVEALGSTYFITGDRVFFTIGQSVLVGATCLNNNTYCSNAINTTGGVACSVANTQHCAHGCSMNSSGTFCDNTGGNNTCNIIGQRQCTSTTSYYTCSDFDSNGFYDTDNTTICPVGQYCQANGTYDASCQAVSSSGLSHNGAINVVPYSVSSNTTVYSLDQNKRVLAVTTSDFSHTQRFYTSGASSYVARDCQYNEVNIYTSTAQTVLLNATSYPFAQTINNNARVTLNILPSNNNYVNVTVLDQLGVSMGGYDIIRDVANKSVKIYYRNGTLLYTDFSQNTFDDLTNLNMTFIYDFQSQTYTTTFTFDRNTDNRVSTQAQLFTGQSISSVLINTTNTTINSLLEGEIFSTNTGFQILVSNDLTFEPCEYTQAGLYHVRTYSYVSGAPDYSNFVDYDINIKQLGASPSVISGANQDKGLSSVAKIWISLIVIIAIMVLLAVLGVILTRHFPAGAGLTLVFSMFGGLVATIMLAVPVSAGGIGYLPSNIALLIGLLEAVLIGLGVKIIFFSSHSPSVR